MSADRQARVWKVIGMGSGLGAGLVARKVLERGWRAARGGQDPPSNPASPDTTWGEALLWALASGVALAVTRLVVQRGAAEAWRVVTGSYPDLDEVRP